MSDIKFYNVLLVEERTDKATGEVKPFYHRVGTMFAHKKGEGFNMVVPEGMSLSGRLLIMPRGEREDAAPDASTLDEFNGQ